MAEQENINLVDGEEYDARLVYVSELGLQEGYTDPKTGVTSPSRDQKILGLEIVGEPVLINDVEQPRILWSRAFSYFDNLTERGIELVMMKLFDNKAKADMKADWSDVLGTPVTVTIKHTRGKGDNANRIFDNIDSIVAMPKKYQKDVLPAATTTLFVSTDCNASNPAQDAMFGLSRFIWNRRIATDRGEPQPSAPAEQAKQAPQGAAGDEYLDDDIPF